jgi:MFS family permease
VKQRLLSIPDLPSLLYVGFVSYVVRWLETLAFALFAYQATQSAFVVVMLTMLRLLPMGLFGAFIGSAAGRHDLRHALALVVGTSGLVTLVLAVLASGGWLSVWHLAVASFVSGICLATDNPVRRMMIGNIVGADRMGAAISIDVGISNASRVIGPLLAGALLAQHGIASALWLGVAACATSLAAALRLARRPPDAGAAGGSFVENMREGLAWLRGDSRMVGLLVITIVFNIFGWPFTSLIPVVATDYFQLEPRGVGLLASCEGIGGLVGSLLLAVMARPGWYGRIYAGAVGMYLVTMVGFALVPSALAAGLMLMLNGISAVGFAVMQATLVYRGAPVEMRARAMGVLSVCIGTSPLGFLYLGVLADILTPRDAMLAISAQGALVLYLSRRYWRVVLQRD